MIAMSLALIASSVMSEETAVKTDVWGESRFFVCETYARHDFNPTGDNRLASDAYFEPDRFAVAYNADEDGPTFKIAASPWLVNDSGVMTFQWFNNGSFDLEFASRGHLPDANHQDAVLLYLRDDARSTALATITQREWLHGDAGLMLERTYFATCVSTSGPDSLAKLREFSS